MEEYKCFTLLKENLYLEVYFIYVLQLFLIHMFHGIEFFRRVYFIVFFCFLLVL